MILKAQAETPKELLISTEANCEELNMAAATQTALHAGDYLPCGAEVVCNDVVINSALQSILFFFGPTSNKLLKKIGQRHILEHVVNQFVKHCGRRVTFRNRQDISGIMEQKTGKFVIRADNKCFAWDADQQLLLDPTQQPAPISIADTIQIDKVYEIRMVDQKRKQDSLEMNRKKQKLANPINNSALNAVAAAVAMSPALYHELSVENLSLEQVMHRVAGKGYVVNRLTSSLSWLLEQTRGTFVIRCNRRCVAWYASLQLILDTDPLSPSPLPINPETLRKLGIQDSSNKMYQISCATKN